MLVSHKTFILRPFKFKPLFLAGLFLGCITLLSQTIYAEALHHVPVHADDFGPDLPLVGSSLFDKVFSKADRDGQVHYDIPFPIARVFAKLRATSSNTVYGYFPFSRSLQRPVDLSYNPLLNPRLTMGLGNDQLHADENLQDVSPEEIDMFNASLFLGYVKATDQLEVISLNHEAGRFEFQIVKDYSTDPKVYYVNRGKCLSCHQGQAGIFPKVPWADSNLGIFGQMVRQKVRSNGDQSQSVIHELFGDLGPNFDTQSLDALTIRSNRMARQQRAWVYGCGKDNRCRLGLLLKMLAPLTDVAKSEYAYAKSIIKDSPLAHQIFYSSSLTSYDADAEDVIENYGGLKAAVETAEALLQLITNLNSLGTQDNPATKRLDFAAMKNVAPYYLEVFSSTEVQWLRERSGGDQKVAELLLQIFDEGHEVFSSRPINNLHVMSLLADRLEEHELAAKYRQWMTRSTPEKTLFSGALPPVFETRELNIFSRHCRECHGTGFSFPPQFLTGSEAEVLDKMRALQPKLLFRLTDEKQYMPPDPEKRQLLLDSGDDLQVLIRFVKSLN